MTEQLKYLILKDLSFRFKIGLLEFLLPWILIGAIVEGSKTFASYIIFFLPAALFTGFIMFNCYLEDNYSTLNFLKSLPVSKKLLIREKFLLSQLFIIIGIIEIYIFYLLLPGIPFPFQLSHLFIYTAVMEIYFGSYLYLFYCVNFFASRIPPNIYGCLIILLSHSGIEFQTISVSPPLAAVIMVASLIINYLLMTISIKKMR